MRIIECAQGSPEWRAARLGIPTASQFSRILTPTKLEYAKGAETYIRELLAEWLTGEPQDEGGSGWTDRGTGMEDEARAWYEAQYDVTVRQVGFCVSDDGTVGCSPDGLVGDDGGLEIKCPAAKTHIGYLLDPMSLVADYRHQIQGGLYVTGRKWWDVVSYSPIMPAVVVRRWPETDYHGSLGSVLDLFTKTLGEHKAALAAKGCKPAAERRAEAKAREDVESQEWMDSFMA